MENLSSRWHSLIARSTRPRSRLSEPPLRGDLLTVEQLGRHAKAVAVNHKTIIRRSGNRLLARLHENEEILRAFNHATVAVMNRVRSRPPPNGCSIISTSSRSRFRWRGGICRADYSQELPRLVSGPSAGLPRVYDIVLELISHVDAQVDAASLTAFVAAYQTVSAAETRRALGHSHHAAPGVD